MPSFLALTDVSVKYQASFEPVIHDINLNIADNQITMIIGPNGSGKSTLIKSILGLVPYQGSILLEDKEPQKLSHAIGYVPQTHTIDLNFPITVQEFLTYSHACCVRPETRNKTIHNTLKSIDAENLINKPINTLSGGQLQRVLLSRALLHHPTLLILDEPETGIDIGAQQTIYDLLIKIKEKYQTSIIIATHEIEAAREYADSVICLNHCVISHTTPERALTPENLKRLYGKHLHY